MNPGGIFKSMNICPTLIPVKQICSSLTSFGVKFNHISVPVLEKATLSAQTTAMSLTPDVTWHFCLQCEWLGQGIKRCWIPALLSASYKKLLLRSELGQAGGQLANTCSAAFSP